MGNRGQTIKLYIAGDDLKNIKIVELSNWTGKLYIGERKHSKIIQNIEDSEYDGCYVLKKDIDFNSPSAAAAVVKNRATNGPKEWKLKNGTNLDEYLSNLNNT